MLFNLECFLCKNAYVMQGCRAGTGAAGTICSEPKSESDIESGAVTAPRKGCQQLISNISNNVRHEMNLF